MERALFFLLAAFGAAVAADALMTVLTSLWMGFAIGGGLYPLLFDGGGTFLAGFGGLLAAMALAQLGLALFRQHRPVLAGAIAGLVYVVIAALVHSTGSGGLSAFGAFPIRPAWVEIHNSLISHIHPFHWFQSFWPIPLFAVAACAAGGWVFGWMIGLLQRAD